MICARIELVGWFMCLEGRSEPSIIKVNMQTVIRKLLLKFNLFKGIGFLVSLAVIIVSMDPNEHKNIDGSQTKTVCWKQFVNFGDVVFHVKLKSYLKMNLKNEESGIRIDLG